MTLADLIVLLQNQVTTLNGARSTAERLGDIAHLIEIDAKLSETNATLAALKEIQP